MTSIIAKLSFPFTNKREPFERLHAHCEAIAKASPGNTQVMRALLLEMMLDYYQDVRNQAQQSFLCALGAAIIGTLFFVYAAGQSMSEPGIDNAYISLIAGALIQVISGISFYLYFRAARQFSSFHICLDRANRFMLANTLCENLELADRKDVMRKELIKIIANAPMLTLDILEKGI